MKFKLLCLVIMFIPFSIRGDEICSDLANYIKLVLDKSFLIESAESDYNKAEDEYEEAVLKKISAFDIKIMEINKNYLRENIVIIRNSIVLSILEKYFAYLNTRQELSFAKKDELIKKTEFDRNTKFYENEIISSELKDNSYLQSLTSAEYRIETENKFNNYRKELFRVVFDDWSNHDFYIHDFADLPEKLRNDYQNDVIIDNYPTIKKLISTIELTEEKYAFYSDSIGIAPYELEKIELELAELKDMLDSERWKIEDSIELFETQRKLAELELQRLDVNINRDYINLDAQKLLFKQGNVQQTTVEAAELNYQKKLYQKKVLDQEIFLYSIKITSLRNMDIYNLLIQNNRQTN